MSHVYAKSVATGSVTSSSVAYPASGVLHSADVAQLYVTLSGVSTPFTTPSGWTLFDTHAYSSSMATYIFRRTLTGSETGSVPLAWGGGTASKIEASLIIKRGVDFGPTAWQDQLTLTTVTVATPAVAIDPDKEYSWSSYSAYRGSVTQTGVTQPAGMTLHDTALGSGGGLAAGGISSIDTPVTGVSTVGSGTWTWAPSGSSGGRIAHTQTWIEAAAPETPVDPPPSTVPLPYRFQIDVPAFLCVAHRGGDPGPEETLAAYQASYEAAPSSWTEADMQQLGTGEVVFQHDDDISRMADASSPIQSGLVSNLTRTQWRIIKERGNTGYTGVTPTRPGELQDLVDEYGPGTGRTRGHFLEVKQGTDATACIDQIIAGGLDWCTIVNGYNLADVAEAVARGLMGCYQTNAPNFTTINSYGIGYVSVEKSSCTTAMCTAAHAAGVKVIVYTVNSTSDRDTQLAKGVDGVFTNKPATVLVGMAQPLFSKVRVAGATKSQKASCVVIGGSKKHIAKIRVVQGGVAKKLGTQVV